MSDNNGRFKPGESGNPGGRPAGYGRVRDLAQKHTERAIAVLVEIMDDKDAAKDARRAAAEALLNRGWGKPETSVQLSGSEGGWIDVLRRLNRDNPAKQDAAQLMVERQ